MSRVRIPPVLRDVVGGSKELAARGSTVAAVLEDLFARHPALRDRLSDQGRLSSFVNVYVNDQDIRHQEGFDTKVGPDDVVILLPAMAGGGAARAIPGELASAAFAVAAKVLRDGGFPLRALERRSISYSARSTHESG